MGTQELVALRLQGIENSAKLIRGANGDLTLKQRKWLEQIQNDIGDLATAVLRRQRRKEESSGRDPITTDS